MNRRDFLAGVGTSSASSLFPSVVRGNTSFSSLVKNAAIKYKGRIVAPIYAVAYIEPNNPAHQGQERIVAKYPLVLVAQDNSDPYRKWRDDIKQLNPNIITLAYQIVIEEASQAGRGPGHNLLDRVVKNSWVEWPWGTSVRVGRPLRRIFDPRSREWKSAFLEACSRTLASYPYDGLFLDQCTIYLAHHPLKSVRDEMRAHLQAVLIELRRRHPSIILIGNSPFKWKGLNGEMSEHREEKLAQDLRSFSGHSKPEINLGMVPITQSGANNALVVEKLLKTLSYGAFFSASSSYHQIPWFPVYDEILKTIEN